MKYLEVKVVKFNLTKEEADAETKAMIDGEFKSLKDSYNDTKIWLKLYFGFAFVWSLVSAISQSLTKNKDLSYVFGDTFLAFLLLPWLLGTFLVSCLIYVYIAYKADFKINGHFSLNFTKDNNFPTRPIDMIVIGLIFCVINSPIYFLMF